MSIAKPKILIVDDEMIIRMVLDQLIQGYGFESIMAADTVEAAKLLNEHRPDLILLDVGIPGSDSMALLKAIRNNPDYNHARVIMITGGHDLSIIAAYINVGADDYILKPFHAVLVKTRVMHALERLERDQTLQQLKALVSTTVGGLEKAVQDSTEFSTVLSGEINHILDDMNTVSELITADDAHGIQIGEESPT